DSMYSKVSLTDPGPDGLYDTAADNHAIQAYTLNPGFTTSNITVNDDRLSQHYNGLELAVTKRYSKGLTALIGYDYGHTRQDIVGLQNPNNLYVNASGVSGGRRHLINGSASYTLPWYGILVGTEFRVQSGLPITRTWPVPVCPATAPNLTGNCVNQSNLTLN